MQSRIVKLGRYGRCCVSWHEQRTLWNWSRGCWPVKDGGLQSFQECGETLQWIYRMSQEECARLREGVPYVKVYRYNPKHLCPKLNGYGDISQRKVWSSGGSTHCTCQLTSLIDVCPWVWCRIQLTLAYSYVVGLYQNAQSAMLRQCLPSMCHV